MSGWGWCCADCCEAGGGFGLVVAIGVGVAASTAGVMLAEHLALSQLKVGFGLGAGVCAACLGGLELTWVVGWPLGLAD
jgi:hypothetical protein